ncbi:MAG: MFS transporter, partial [Stellaceae bacterium]
MPPLILPLRRRAPIPDASRDAPLVSSGASAAAFGIAPRRLHAVLFIAGTICCLGMSFPQVHLIACCRDLGYGTT